MFKTRYKYNPQTLSFDKIELNSKQRIIKILLSFFGICGFVFITSFLIFYYYFDTTSFEHMQREKKQLLTQYKLLNNRFEHINRVLEELRNRDEDIYRVIFQANPIPATIRNAGIGGSDRYEKLRGYDNSDLMVETSNKIDEISSKINIQAQSFDELYRLAKTKAKELQCLPAIQPVSSNQTQITSFFGYRFNPILQKYRMHEGVDYAGPVGSKIYAPGDGVIVESGFEGGFGREIVINHGFGYTTKFGHLYKILVREGQKVKRGDVIGLLGNSGLSTGPHLHYEVHKDGNVVNPIHYYFDGITPEEYNSLVTLDKKK